MLRLITDIPHYRATRYPAHVRLTTWDGDRPDTIDSEGFNDLIGRLTTAFDMQGYTKGDRICVLSGGGDTHLLASEFALMQLGCTIVPLHAALPPGDMQMIVSEVKPGCCVTKTKEDFAILEKITNTGKLIALDELHTRPLELSDTSDAMCKPEDTALIIYTSGSSGDPKGVMLSHANVISTVLSVLTVIPVRYRHSVLSYLPVSHILERIAIYCYLAAGAHIHFADSPRQGMALLKKVRPHYLTAVPRILDRAVSNFQRAGDTRHYFVRSVLLWALDINSGRQFLKSVIRAFILRRLRRSFGGRLQGILAGGAALNPGTEHLFRAAGIIVREGYGLSECCGVATLNRFEPGGNKPGTVGPPVPGIEIKIEESPGTGSGEVLLKSNGVMQGYYLRPEETNDAITTDGWLKTGDRGEFVENRFLRITGRVKEQFKNAFGEYVSPVKLEQILEQDQWVNRALVIGSGRPSTGVLIVPEFELLEEWCRSQKVHWTAPLYMVHNTQIQQAFESHIALINKSLSTHEQIQKFKLIHESWSVENGLLTPSLKLKRDVIEEHYKKTIDEMYRG